MEKETTFDSFANAPSEELGDHSSISEDDARLIAMGKKPELKRVHGFWSLLSFQIYMSCSWACLVVLFDTIFDVGGPVGLVYGTLCVGVGQTVLMMSLAEFAGIWPTAGGQVFFTQALATEKVRPLLSYLVGWAVLVGEVSIGASCAINTSHIIQSFVEVTHPEYSWKPWLSWVIYSVFLFGPLAINMIPKAIPSVNILGAIFVIGGGLAWVISFGVKAPKHDADFIFKLFVNNSGYTNSGWVFIMSFYSPMYGLYGTDGILHLVEEMRDASREAPRAMVWSMIFCSLTAWLAAVFMMWTSSNWEVYMQGVQPYMDWWMDVLGLYGGGIFCALVMIGLNFFVLVGTNVASSRLVWSMARDRGFPFSNYLAVVNPRLGIPLRATLVVVGIMMVLGLIVLGNDVAFQSIISASGVALQVGYLTPVLVVLIRGRKILPKRPHFDLGKFGYLVNIVSVCWALLTIAMYLAPLYMPITSETIDYMNWSCVIIGAIILLTGLFWIFSARHTYLKFSNTIMEENAVFAVVDEGPTTGFVK